MPDRNSREKDELYVLGDVVDRGHEPIKVLQDMMKRSNVICILGNHDFIMYTLMKKLSVEITEENYDKYLTSETLPDYIAGASLYVVIENNGKECRLAHAGLSNFSPDKDLDEYELYELLEERADYSRRYYPHENIFLVTGHADCLY